jgi:hypothetical protein
MATLVLGVACAMHFRNVRLHGVANLLLLATLKLQVVACAVLRVPACIL